MSYTRREFLKRLGLMSGGVMLAPILPSCSSSSSGEGLRVLTDEEALCLTHLCERIIPTDQDPGAVEAGVVNFIDKQCATRFPAERGLFAQGVKALEAFSQDLMRMPFEHLSPYEQIAIMEAMERGDMPVSYWDGVDQKEFMSKLVTRVMQGFYGSPRHGGNKDYVSYKMLKLDYPLVVGQNRYK